MPISTPDHADKKQLAKNSSHSTASRNNSRIQLIPIFFLILLATANAIERTKHNQNDEINHDNQELEKYLEGYIALHQEQQEHIEHVASNEPKHKEVKLKSSSKPKSNSKTKTGTKNPDNEIIYNSVVQGDIHVVKRMLLDGVDVNTKINGTYLIQAAAAKNDTAMMQLLLSKHAVVDARDNVNQKTPLYIAVENGMLENVKILLARGADINTRYLSNDGIGLLHIAAQGNQNEVLKYLLDQGLNVNTVTYKGDSALHCAIFGRNTKGVKLLLQRGADPNAANNQGALPLALAVGLKGAVDETQLLLTHGANPNAIDTAISRYSVLGIAYRKSNWEQAELLIKYGAVEGIQEKLLKYATTIMSIMVLSTFLSSIAVLAKLTLNKRNTAKVLKKHEVDLFENGRDLDLFCDKIFLPQQGIQNKGRLLAEDANHFLKEYILPSEEIEYSFEELDKIGNSKAKNIVRQLKEVGASAFYVKRDDFVKIISSVLPRLNKDIKIIFNSENGSLKLYFFNEFILRKNLNKEIYSICISDIYNKLSSESGQLKNTKIYVKLLENFEKAKKAAELKKALLNTSLKFSQLERVKTFNDLVDKLKGIKFENHADNAMLDEVAKAVTYFEKDKFKNAPKRILESQAKLVADWITPFENQIATVKELLKGKNTLILDQVFCQAANILLENFNNEKFDPIIEQEDIQFFEKYLSGENLGKLQDLKKVYAPDKKEQSSSEQESKNTTNKENQDLPKEQPRKEKIAGNEEKEVTNEQPQKADVSSPAKIIGALASDQVFDKSTSDINLSPDVNNNNATTTQQSSQTLEVAQYYPDKKWTKNVEPQQRSSKHFSPIELKNLAIGHFKELQLHLSKITEYDFHHHLQSEDFKFKAIYQLFRMFQALRLARIGEDDLNKNIKKPETSDQKFADNAKLMRHGIAHCAFNLDQNLIAVAAAELNENFIFQLSNEKDKRETNFELLNTTLEKNPLCRKIKEEKANMKKIDEPAMLEHLSEVLTILLLYLTANDNKQFSMDSLKMLLAMVGEVIFKLSKDATPFYLTLAADIPEINSYVVFRHKVSHWFDINGNDVADEEVFKLLNRKQDGELIIQKINGLVGNELLKYSNTPKKLAPG